MLLVSVITDRHSPLSLERKIEALKQSLYKSARPVIFINRILICWPLFTIWPRLATSLLSGFKEFNLAANLNWLTSPVLVHLSLLAGILDGNSGIFLDSCAESFAREIQFNASLRCGGKLIYLGKANTECEARIWANYWYCQPTLFKLIAYLSRDMNV